MAVTKRKIFAITLMIVLVLAVVLGIMPFVIHPYHAFLPSPYWISAVRPLALVAGLSTAVLTLWMGLIGWRRSEVRLDKKLAGVILGPFLIYLLVTNAVIFGPPVMIALLFGHQVEIYFTVASPNGPTSKGCGSSVQLEGLPFLLDSFCVRQSSMKDGLVQGAHIAAIGRGSSYGLFFKIFRQID